MSDGAAPPQAAQKQKSSDVVIVDDDANVREAIRKFLNDKGFSVQEAESGAHAVKLLERMSWNWTPTAFITDLVMPGTGGYELIRKLSTKYKGKKIPVVVMSRLATREDIVEAELAGAHAFVVKPFRLGRLFEALQTVTDNFSKPAEERKNTIFIFQNS